MTARAILSLALVVAVTGIAAAEPTKVGVLGLEVAGVIDIDGTTQAKNITEVMRSQVRPPRFSLAPNSKKELIDEKVANNCDSEATDCMTKIAKKIGATVLIFGRIDARPTRTAATPISSRSSCSALRKEDDQAGHRLDR
jgi:hypothetical protein